jgi:hypothetical protein
MSRKQAILLIHGIGEQRPMDTLRGFVQTVWATNRDIQHEHAVPGVFSKPDDISGSYELRRLTTTMNRHEVRTDFFEFYWAHLMEGTSIQHVFAWARRLLFRSPRSVPKQLVGAWALLVVVFAAVAFFALQAIMPDQYRLIALPKAISGVLSAILAWAAVPVINSIIGDAARYLDPAPANIKRRQAIRAKGVEILRKLHDSGEYDRLIVVGHSLGSVIGYDILTYAWPAFAAHGDEKTRHPVLDALETDVSTGGLAASDYHRRQRALLHELQSNGCRWLVTDFITLGSPLTHADILLARDQMDLKSKIKERELPACPPAFEANKFSYPHNRVHRTLHHAAMFAPTRWTNIYFPSRWLVRGDLIGGPLRGVFGKGILDLPVNTNLQRGFLSHTLYWTMTTGDDVAPHITALRAAVNLLDD